MARRRFHAPVAVPLLAVLTACGSGPLDDSALTPHYLVDKRTGLCFSEVQFFAAYSHAWTPCTPRVVGLLREDTRRFADRETGVAAAAAKPGAGTSP